MKYRKLHINGQEWMYYIGGWHADIISPKPNKKRYSPLISSIESDGYNIHPSDLKRFIEESILSAAVENETIVKLKHPYFSCLYGKIVAHRTDKSYVINSFRANVTGKEYYVIRWKNDFEIDNSLNLCENCKRRFQCWTE